MIKLLFCFMIVVGSGYVGWGFGFYYVAREKFFSELIRFLEFARSEILFLQSKRKVIFEKFETNQKCLAQLLKTQVLENENKNEIKEKSYGLLSVDEKTQIQNFLNSIGKKDVENECASIDNFKEVVVSWQKKSIEEKNKYSNSSTKLGVAFGLAISIIIF